MAIRLIKKVCVQKLGFVWGVMLVAIASVRDFAENLIYNVIGIDVLGEADLRKAISINDAFHLKLVTKKLKTNCKRLLTLRMLKRQQRDLSMQTLLLT